MSTQDLQQLIRNDRRSVFPQFFVDRPIDTTTLESILENANWAPSHRQTEPWRFVAFRGPGRARLFEHFEAAYRRKIPADRQDDRKLRKTHAKMTAADTVLAIVLHRDPRESVPEWEEIAAVAMAVQNLWLSLDAYGIGGYWSSPGVLTDTYGDLPWLATNERCLGIFYLGHHEAPELPRHRGDWREKVRWEE